MAEEPKLEFPGVRVKQLEWEYEVKTMSKPETWRARCVDGEYDVQREDNLFSTWGFNFPIGVYGTIDEAKAAAQAEYERRVLSALEPTRDNAALLRDAAPDMLAALKAMDAIWMGPCPYGPYSDEALANLSKERRLVWRQIRAAIAKAEGHSDG